MDLKVLNSDGTHTLFPLAGVTSKTVEMLTPDEHQIIRDAAVRIKRERRVRTLAYRIV